MEGVEARHLPLSKGKSKVLIDSKEGLKQGLLRQLESLGIDECDTARNVAADLQLGRADAPSSSGSDLGGRREERNAPSSFGRPRHTLAT